MSVDCLPRAMLLCTKFYYHAGKHQHSRKSLLEIHYGNVGRRRRKVRSLAKDNSGENDHDDEDVDEDDYDSDNEEGGIDYEA